MLFRRILTVLVAAPIVLAAIFFDAVLFKGLVLVCTALAYLEYFKLIGLTPLEKKGGMVLGLAHSASLLFLPGEFLLAESAALVMAVFSFFLVVHAEPKETAVRLGMTLAGLFYVGTLASLIGLLRDFPEGIAWVLILLAVTWANDSFAYLAGHWWGKRKLAPRISPGKTWEGFWGGLAGGYVGLFLVGYFVGGPPDGIGRLLLPLLCGVAGPVGDLSESLLKRSSGVKDSGQIIPGHGGMLDRMDALLFNAPVVYGFALWFR